MIIISSSIPKSGSTLVYNYQQDLLSMLNSDNKTAQKKYKRLSYLGFTRVIGIKAFLIAVFISIKYGDIVIKTHSKPTLFIKLLIALKLAKATFCYRDPRDVILSAIDHGTRTRKGLDSSNAFRNMTTINNSLNKVKNWTKKWYAWKKFDNVLFIRYENLVESKVSCLQAMSSYFDLGLQEEQITEIYVKNENIKKSAWNFNKGTSQRYKTEMDSFNLQLCNRELENVLEDMQYSV